MAQKITRDILEFWFGEVAKDVLGTLKGQVTAETSARWFNKSPDFDQIVAKQFGTLLNSAANELLLLDGCREQGDITTKFPVEEQSRLTRLDVSQMHEDPEGRLALIILFDQFPRNIYRGMPQSFAYDSLALMLTKTALLKENRCRPTANRLDMRLCWPVYRQFFYMPLMHSENIEDQNLCVTMFENLRDNAVGDESQYKYMSFALDFAERHRSLIQKYGRFPHRNQILDRISTEEEKEYLSQPGAGF